MPNLKTLIRKRNELADALADTEPGAYPGSAAARAADRAGMALELFDEKHPEVLQEVSKNRRHRAAIKRALAGED